MSAFALILAGGDGARLAPLSTPEKPKQFLNLYGNASLLQHAYRRIHSLFDPHRIFLAANHKHAHWLAQQIPEIDASRWILESRKKSTAAPIVLGAHLFNTLDQNAVMCIFTADHWIGQDVLFQDTIREAIRAVSSDGKGKEKLIVFGVPPGGPSPEYGYIEAGECVEGAGGKLYKVERFIEKPDASRAEQYLQDDNMLWNIGLLCARTRVVLGEFERYLPDLYRRAIKVPVLNERIPNEASDRFFSDAESISIDRGILERSREAWVLRGDFEWSDLGTFETLEQMSFIKRT